MSWVDTWPPVEAVLDADAVLVGITGRVLPLESNAKRKIPSLRYSVIWDSLRETTWPVGVQLTYWARSRDQAKTIEARIHALHRDRMQDVDGRLMWLLYQGGRDMADPQPGVVSRSLDYRCEPVRG